MPARKNFLHNSPIFQSITSAFFYIKKKIVRSDNLSLHLINAETPVLMNTASAERVNVSPSRKLSRPGSNTISRVIS